MDFFKNIFGKLHDFFGGSSPITGYIGSLGIVITALTMFQEALATGGMPKNKEEWIALLLSLGVRFAKDFNRSNAPKPTTAAAIVE